MQLFTLFVNIVFKAVLDTPDPELYPFADNLTHSEHHRHILDKHVEIAAETVLQRGQLKELEHKGIKFIVNGMLDGVLIHEATGAHVGFEFKTKSNTVAQVGHYLLKRPYDYHVEQTVAYYLLTGVRDYLLVYEGLAKPRWKDMEEAKPDLRAFHVYITDEMVEKLLDKWAYVAQSVYNREMPEDTELGCFSGYGHLFDGDTFLGEAPDKKVHYRGWD